MGQRWRNTKDYHEWRDAVVDKYGGECYLCSSPIKPQAHHVDSASYFPESRFVVNNGILFCKRCHSTFHILYKQGYRKKATRKDLKKFIAIAKRYMTIGKKLLG